VNRCVSRHTACNPAHKTQGSNICSQRHFNGEYCDGVRTMRSAAWASLGLIRLAGLRCASVTARCFSAEIVAAVRTFVDRRSDGADAGSAGSVNLTFFAVHVLQNQTHSSSTGEPYAIHVFINRKPSHQIANDCNRKVLTCFMQRLAVHLSREEGAVPSFFATGCSISPAAFAPLSFFALAWAAFLSAACL
jgi:hypothetical protein